MSILQIVITYKYAFFVPIAIIESNGLSLVSGVLGRVGAINPFIAALIIILTDLGGDVVLYFLGYHKGMRAVGRWGKYLALTPESVEKIVQLYHDHKSKILFISKITNGLGLATVVLFAAGLSRISFRTYMLWNIIGEFLWTSFLVFVGYLFSHLYLTIDNAIARIGFIGGAIGIAVLAWRINKYIRNRIVQ